MEINSFSALIIPCLKESIHNSHPIPEFPPVITFEKRKRKTY